MKRDIEELNGLLPLVDKAMITTKAAGKMKWRGKKNLITFRHTKCFKNNLASISALWVQSRLMGLHHKPHSSTITEVTRVTPFFSKIQRATKLHLLAECLGVSASTFPKWSHLPSQNWNWVKIF